MTLSQCYQQNQGQALLTPGGGDGNNGQCVQWADTVLYEVYGLQYHYANAIDWWNNPGELLANFNQINDGSIAAGDFVIYGTGVGSKYGHIDVAAQDGNYSSYVGYDSNWGGSRYYNSAGFPILHEVVHNDTYNKYILGVLRLKGGNNMADTSKPTSTQVGKIYPTLVGRQPTQDELNLAVGLNWYDWLNYLLPGVQTLRDTITNLENDRDTHLYPYIEAVTSALGLPDSATPDDCVKVINELKKGVHTVTVDGVNYQPA